MKPSSLSPQVAEIKRAVFRALTRLRAATIKELLGRGQRVHEIYIWVVVKIMVPLWVLIIIRHLLFRVPKIGTLILTTTHIHMYRNMYMYIYTYTHTDTHT